MRNDHRPYRLKVALARLEAFWVKHFIRPQLDALGRHSMIMKPWFLKLYGKGIRFGESVHVITARDRTVRLTTWAMNNHQGNIDVGDFVLLCPGVRIDSASLVTIGESSMLAAGAYITDADWHDLYDRTEAIGRTTRYSWQQRMDRRRCHRLQGGFHRRQLHHRRRLCCHSKHPKQCYRCRQSSYGYQSLRSDKTVDYQARHIGRRRRLGATNG